MLPATAPERSTALPSVPLQGSFDGIVMPLQEAERILIRNALRAKRGNREHAARALGISERTLYRKIREYGDRVTG
jgi:DNA-binding NtrC family response regulator